MICWLIIRPSTKNKIKVTNVTGDETADFCLNLVPSDGTAGLGWDTGQLSLELTDLPNLVRLAQ